MYASTRATTLRSNVMTAHASATTDDSAPNNRADTDWWIRLRCVVSFGALGPVAPSDPDPRSVHLQPALFGQPAQLLVDRLTAGTKHLGKGALR